jgi:hypothetical protein
MTTSSQPAPEGRRLQARAGLEQASQYGFRIAARQLAGS